MQPSCAFVSCVKLPSAFKDYIVYSTRGHIPFPHPCIPLPSFLVRGPPCLPVKRAPGIISLLQGDYDSSELSLPTFAVSLRLFLPVPEQNFDILAKPRSRGGWVHKPRFIGLRFQPAACLLASCRSQLQIFL